MISSTIRKTSVGVLAFSLFCLTVDVEAGRRSKRIDFQAWDDAQDLGSSACPGSVEGSPDVTWLDFTFSGSTTNTYNVDDYCQEAFQYDAIDDPSPDEYLNESVFPEDEAGLAQKIGANNDPDPFNQVTARRYTFLDRDRFSESPEPTGFQWGFYFFPGNITLVTLYGEIPVGSNNFTPEILGSGGNPIWSGQIQGYDGEYWCFNGDTFVGTWDGEPAGTAPLAGCEIDTNCYEFWPGKDGPGAYPTVSPLNSSGCPANHFRPGELVTLRATPDPGNTVLEWYGTDDDTSLSLVNQVTIVGDEESAGVFYGFFNYCSEDTVRRIWMQEDMEGGAIGWSHSSATGADTWSLDNTDFVSSNSSWRATVPDVVSDQRLVSPAVSIPAFAASTFLSFHNQRSFDWDGSSSCGDGALVEYSVDNGTTWTNLEYSDTDNYNSFIESSSSNPISGFPPAWCDDRTWINANFALPDVAGQSVRFRFRVGSDSAGSHDGWWIDDVQVSGCIPSQIIADGFEGP